LQNSKNAGAPKQQKLSVRRPRSLVTGV